MIIQDRQPSSRFSRLSDRLILALLGLILLILFLTRPTPTPLTDTQWIEPGIEELEDISGYPPGAENFFQGTKAVQ